MPGTNTPTLPAFDLLDDLNTPKVVSVNPYPCLISKIFNRLLTIA